jgi:hypothetical protein
LAAYCSRDVFTDLENSVLCFYPMPEKETVKLQLEKIRDRRWPGNEPNHYGLAQYALLLALPPEIL